MFSAEPAFPPGLRPAESSFCPHIIGQVRLWVYHGAVAHARGTGLA